MSFHVLCACMGVCVCVSVCPSPPVPGEGNLRGPRMRPTSPSAVSFWDCPSGNTWGPMESTSQKDPRGQGVTLRTSGGCRYVPALWSLMSFVFRATWEELYPSQGPLSCILGKLSPALSKEVMEFHSKHISQILILFHVLRRGLTGKKRLAVG